MNAFVVVYGEDAKKIQTAPLAADRVHEAQQFTKMVRPVVALSGPERAGGQT